MTAVLNPSRGVVEYFDLHGMPFGATHAVHNFNRVAEWLCRTIRRFYRMVLEHYFDDFFCVEPGFSAVVAMYCLKRTINAFGFSLDPNKTQSPSRVFPCLGVAFDFRSCRELKRVVVRPKKSRLSNLRKEINEILFLRLLRPARAGRLVGKLQFVSDTLYGKIGRAGLGALRARQYQRGGSFKLDNNLEYWLRWWLDIFDALQPRTLPVEPRQIRPTILYTDGSEQGDNRVICGVLFSPKIQAPQFFSHVLTAAAVARWCPKQTMINQVEASAGIVALDTWADLLRDSDVIHFIDSNTSLNGLVNGWSRKSDTCHLVGLYWKRAALLKAFMWIDRVESESNIADGPTKNRYDSLDKLDAVEVQPEVDCLYR